MRRNHEQSVIDIFVKRFREIGSKNGRKTYQFSLDGQDALVGADYIFNTNTNFALVEFKYEKIDLRSEGKKRLRKITCENLKEDNGRYLQSLECHFIAWSQKGTTREIYLNQYYPTICNQKIFPDSRILPQDGDSSSEVSSKTLIENFLRGYVGASFNVFKSYTDWLLSLGETGAGGIEVMMDNPERNQSGMLEFNNLDLLHDWLIQNDPSPTLSNSYGPQ